MIAVRLVGDVMVLANVNSLVVVPAVVPVITQRLQPNPLTCLYVVVSERSTTSFGFHNLERIRSLWNAVL
jgi:hypothetical protein